MFIECETSLELDLYTGETTPDIEFDDCTYAKDYLLTINTTIMNK